MTLRNPAALALILLGGCGGESKSEAPAAMSVAQEAEEEDGRRDQPTRSAPKGRGRPSGGLGGRGEGYGGGGTASVSAAPTLAPAPMEPAAPPPPMDEAQGAKDGKPEAQATRAWFPETFLFAPAVITDAEGHAALLVRVPDRLTTWRILALAHSKAGGLGGDVHSVLGTLPIYVDPVVPPQLRVGDAARLPLQVVNTTGSPVSGELSLSGGGAGSVGGQGAVTVPAFGSRVVWASLRAERPGVLALRAALSGADSVVREIPVVPVGRKLTQSRGGTLASPRTFTLTGANDVDPSSATASLYVYPGALSILRSELASAGGRGGPGYGMLLAGQGPVLLKNLGVTLVTSGDDAEGRAAAESLRTLGLLSVQAALREARMPDAAVASRLVVGAASLPDNTVASRLTDRLFAMIAEGQRPDGTFGGALGESWSLQRLLVATAESVRALNEAAALPVSDPQVAQRRKQMADRARLLASGAVERNLGRVNDPYTASALLSAGLVSGASADTLRGLVTAGLVEQDDGSLLAAVPEGVVRGDGLRPSPLMATSLAILALEAGGPADTLADLGASVVGGWQPGLGWGDAETDMLCLRAVLALFRDPPPAEVTLRLTRDGEVVESRTLRKADLDEVVLLSAPAGDVRGAHTWAVEATPPVAGLGFAFHLDGYVPWASQARSDGIELQAALPGDLRVGQPAVVSLTIAAPAGRALKVVHALPAGVVGEAGLGAIPGLTVKEGRVEVEIGGLSPGEVWKGAYTVVPTLGGSLWSGPVQASYADRPEAGAVLAPTQWEIL